MLTIETTTSEEGSLDWDWLSLDELAGTAAEWALLERNHTDWYDAYQATGPWGSRADLTELAKTAPTSMAKGLLYGVLACRHDVAALTQVPFA